MERQIAENCTGTGFPVAKWRQMIRLLGLLQTLADSVDIHVSQIRRYENGQTQPTLDVIRKLAISLGTSADLLVFDKAEREPRGDLKRQFEALNGFDEEEIKVVKTLLESLILKHNAKRAFVEG